MTEGKKQTQEEIRIISKHDFYFETPLYEKINFDKLENGEDVVGGEIDAWSSRNNTETTYRISSETIEEFEHFVSGRGRLVYAEYCIVSLSCKRKDDVLRFFIFRHYDDEFFVKVGQDPSIAELQFSDISRKYGKILEKEYLSEFKKSIVSASHGYGVAAFVYLRRILENLILEEYDLQKDSLVQSDDFINLRMREKIELLKDFLPEQLIEMKGIYGILSKGVHELSEQECMTYFGPLKLSIELILDQKIEKKKKEDKDDLVKKQIQEIQQNIK